MYIDELGGIVDEYNNTYHRSIKMKPTDVKDNTYDFDNTIQLIIQLILRKKLIIKIQKLKLVIT